MYNEYIDQLAKSSTVIKCKECNHVTIMPAFKQSSSTIENMHLIKKKYECQGCKTIITTIIEQ